MIEHLRTRRSIRRFQDIPIDPELIAQLEEAVLRCPTSRNRKPWEFVFVQDRQMLVRLSRCKPHGSSFLANAALGVVVCGDEMICDVWVEDCAIASIVLQLCAHSLGLGSCWVQIRERMHDEQRSAEDYLRECLSLPGTLRVGAVIAIGHPAEHPEPRPDSGLDRHKVHRERWSE